MKGGEAALSVLIIIFSLTACVSGHVPEIKGGNEGIENAVYLDDPFKSWAFYGTFEIPDRFHTMNFTLKKGKGYGFQYLHPKKILSILKLY